MAVVCDPCFFRISWLLLQLRKTKAFSGAGFGNKRGSCNNEDMLGQAPCPNI